MMLRRITIPVAMIALLLAVNFALSQPPQLQAGKLNNLGQFVQYRFRQWDSNHNGVLNLAEIHQQMANRSVQSLEAATLVAIFRQLKKDDCDELRKADVLSLTRNRQFQRGVESDFKKLQSVNRQVFAANDPDLRTFHQGRLGDCYFLSPIAAAVYRDPRAVRDMIQPGKSGGFNVVFGDGHQVYVSPLTDAELLLGSKIDGTHGIWLSVLEKAYGLICEQENPQRSSKLPDTKTHVVYQIIGGGMGGPIISLLTGHDYIRTPIQPNFDLNQLHLLLTQQTRSQRLTCCGAPKGKPAPGMAGKHVYAILDYDSVYRRVKIFNPWGNNFNPKGRPGLANGYQTVCGVFVVPLQEFPQLFGSVACETDKPLAGSSVSKKPASKKKPVAPKRQKTR